MRLIIIILLLPIYLSINAQIGIGYSPTTSNPLIWGNVSIGDIGLYSKVRWGEIHYESISFNELCIGTGGSYQVCDGRAKLLIGISYCEYEYTSINSHSPYFDINKLKTWGFDFGLLVKVPETKGLYIYVNNEFVNWVLDIGIGYSFTIHKGYKHSSIKYN